MYIWNRHGSNSSRNCNRWYAFCIGENDTAELSDDRDGKNLSIYHFVKVQLATASQKNTMKTFLTTLNYSIKCIWHVAYTIVYEERKKCRETRGRKISFFINLQQWCIKYLQLNIARMDRIFLLFCISESGRVKNLFHVAARLLIWCGYTQKLPNVHHECIKGWKGFFSPVLDSFTFLSENVRSFVVEWIRKKTNKRWWREVRWGEFQFSKFEICHLIALGNLIECIAEYEHDCNANEVEGIQKMWEIIICPCWSTC